MNQYREFTNAELDEILDEVSRVFDEAQLLAKSKEGNMNSSQNTELPSDKKPEETLLKQEEKPEEKPEEEPEEKPEEEPEEEPEEKPEEEPEEKSEEKPEEKPEEVSITDEELKEIYQSIDPNEMYDALAPEQLESHFMILRDKLHKLYQIDDKSQESLENKGQHEDKIISQLQQENQQLKEETAQIKKSLDLMTKIIEVGFMPQRKSVEGLSFIAKSALDDSSRSLTKEELDAQIRAMYRDQTKVSSLTKSDRDAINSYILYGANKEQVEKIIKGGK